MSLSLPQQLETFRRMHRIRQFEEALIAKNMPGHLSIGQEAAVVGACMALKDDDYITGTHRSHGHPIGKGAELRPLMAELFGKVTGVCKGRGGSMHLADSRVGIIGESAIVGGGIPLATGAGLSIQIRKTSQVALSFFGDGASNQGTFAESLNLAALWKLPVIFFCENNGYAISTSVSKSHAQPDVAKRASGYGIPGVIVDGQEVEEVHAATETAVARARAGEGPTLIEAKTYRFDEHSRNLSVPIPYRSEEEIESYRRDRDPIVLYRTVLESRGVAPYDLDSIESEVADAIVDALVFARESDDPKLEDLYDNMFSNPIHFPADAGFA